jgi:hypothetical protein
MYYIGNYKELQKGDFAQISLKITLFRLFSAIREHKGGIASNRRSERCGEFNP